MTITFDRVGFRYPGRPTAALADVAWTIGDGELALVAGPSGAGKSTLLRCVNGLVPHFTGGELSGRVTVHGFDTRTDGPRTLSRTVGFVFQDPDAQHVAPTVEDELAFGMEQLGVPVSTMRARVAETLDLLGLTNLRGRSIATLSGGERQRVAIGAAIAVRPRVLVLDEPLSQLDPVSADQVVGSIRALNREHGLTVVVAEHRLDRLLPLTDQIRVVAAVDDNECSTPGSALDMSPSLRGSTSTTGAGEGLPYRPLSFDGATVQLVRADLGIGRRAILAEVTLDIGPGELVALVGPNGSGKTTLLRSLLGALPPLGGRVVVDTGGGRVAYLPQRPGAVLFNETVRDELAFTRRASSGASDPAWLVDLLELGPLLDRDPRDLSAGERERAALGAVLAAGPALVLLDEPTRGMDPRRKATLAHLLRLLAGGGATVVVATHDLDLASAVATRVVLLGDGGIVGDGPPGEVMAAPRDDAGAVLHSRP